MAGWTSTACAAALICALFSPAIAADVLPGPIPAVVERVVDGDTIEVRAKVWLGQEILVRVRLAGIDTPELAGHCAYERSRAELARSHVEHALRSGAIALVNIRGEKYFGRVLAEVRLPGGGDLSQSLLASGLARAYRGGHRCGWCPGSDRCEATGGL